MRIIAFAVSLMIVAAFGVSAKTAAKKSAAKIILPEAVWDFGQIPEGKILKRDVSIVNKGNKTLEIEALIEGCSCLAVSIDKNKILPGKSAKMKIEYDSHGSAGEIERTVQIMSNDPENKVLVYTIKGTISE